MASRKTMSIWIIAAGVVVATIGYVVYVFVLPDVMVVPMRFDSAKWQASPSEMSYSSVRLRMVDDFLQTQKPVGKSRSQIVALLGEPDDTDYFSSYQMVYHLGLERSSIAIDSEWLVMRVDEQNIITEARLVTD